MHAGAKAARACSAQTSRARKNQPLVEYPPAFGPDRQWNFDLLGFPDLPSQSRSANWVVRLSGGCRYLDLRSPAWSASVREPAGMDLQPYQSRSVYARRCHAPALVLRLFIHAEWTCLSRRNLMGRRMARTAAAIGGRIRRDEDGCLLCRNAAGDPSAETAESSGLQQQI